MNTILHSPLISWLWSAQPRQRAASPRPDDDSALDALAELDIRLLHDIGAPEPLALRALARQDARRQCLDELHLGIASGGWRHW